MIEHVPICSASGFLFQYGRLTDNTDIDTVVELLVFQYVQFSGFMFQYFCLADNTDIDTLVELLVFHYVQLLVYVSVCSPRR